MGLYIIAKIFQEKMGDLFADLETVKEYIYDLLVVTKGDCTEHLTSLDTVLHSIHKSVLKVNISKYFFGKHE